MAKYKTPGVYIQEIDTFGNSIEQVATAIPAFIGYTEKAEKNGQSLLNTPTRIASALEFMDYFGGAPTYKYQLTTEGKASELTEFIIKENNYYLNYTGEKYNLFNALRLFFHNGGGPCYIIAVGNYSDAIDKKKLIDNGIPPLVNETEPTLVVVPEAISLKQDACFEVQQAVLNHCGSMQNRVAILDIFDGYKDRNHPDGDVIANFRAAIGTTNLSYGAAYYPWLHTTIVNAQELGLENFTTQSLTILKTMISAELNIPEHIGDNESSRTTLIREVLNNLIQYHSPNYKGPTLDTINETLQHISPTYTDLINTIKKELNVLAPSAAMAGIYTAVDNSRGVWKAPANMSLNSVARPVINITSNDQEDLNAPALGKAVNAIRTFVGEGTLVWGARTLDANSLDWRYINVRRTLIMIEQSIKNTLTAYAFQPNTVNTWTSIKGMISNFLYTLWQQGALAGTTPEQAYNVNIGLGTTMTANDILEGRLKIQVMVAVIRPAEFIVIAIEQQMQTA